MRKGYLYLAMIALMVLWTTTSRAQQAGAQAGETLLTASFPASQAGTSQAPVIGPVSSEGQPSSPVVTMPPLSGAQVLAPTFGGTSENYWVPALACTEYATTNPNGINRNSGLFSESACAGNVTLQKVDRHSQLNLDFIGGGFYYNRPYETATKQYGTAGELAVAEQVNGRRWNWMLGDQGSYLPEGSVGYEPFADLSTFAGGVGGTAMSSAPALNGAFSPNQSVYAGEARRFSDLALSQLSYAAGPRTTLTATAMFGTLQYLTPGYIDNRYWTVMTGYNRTFGRSNQVALSYDEMHYNFGPSQPEMVTRGASILYGRSISPRFTVELSVAPTARATGSTTSFYLGTYDSVQYRALRWDGTLGLDRTLTGGGGFLGGVEMTMVMASLGRQLSRRVHGSLNMAYAENQSLAQISSGALRPAYDYVQAGANLTHELGPHISMYLNYSVQRETSNTPICAGASCSTVYFRQTGGFGINWHARPIKID